MRTLTRTLVLAAGLAFTAAPALAASQAKTEYKEIKKDHKTISKLTKKYEKAIPKGKDGALTEDIREWAKNELADLRGMGVKTKEDKPDPVHPREAGNAPEPKKSDTPWLDEIADILKDVRDTKEPNGRLAAMKKADSAYAKWESNKKAKL
ncbi:MAG: hypothetical protein R3F61_06230 [Myxococcota bacterium]